MKLAGEFAALGTAVCWACGSTLFAAAGKRLGSVLLNRMRITAALVLLSATLLVTRGAAWPTWATGPQIGFLAASGLVGFVFGDTFYFRSLIILGPSRATLLASLAPLFTAIVAWPVLGEHPGPMSLVGMALILAGLAWVLQDRAHAAHEHAEGSVTVGIVAGILAAVGQAVGLVISKLALRTGIDPLSGTVIRVSAATLAVWLLAVVWPSDSQPMSRLKDRTAAWTTLGGAFFGPFLGVTLSLLAVQHTHAGVAASIMAFYPVITIFLSARFHGERITVRMLSGALIAVGGVVVLFLK